MQLTRRRSPVVDCSVNLGATKGLAVVSIVVPCRNEYLHIEKCVRSLMAQALPPGGFEIIVSDGMSDDGTRDILARLQQECGGQAPVVGRPFIELASSGDTTSPGSETSALNPRAPLLRVVDNNAGVTPCGMNSGIRASCGQWIAIMGAHNRYAPDYLVRCLEGALLTGVDNIGGAMVCEGETLVQKAIAAAHHSAFAVGGARWHKPDYEGPADTVFGGFYKREVFERIGLFDEGFVRNQDDEFNLRLIRSGGTIWHSPLIKSWYRPRNSLGGLFRQYIQYGYWKVRVIQKHKLPASPRHLVPGAFLLTLALLLLLSTCSFLLSTAAPVPWSVVSHFCFLLSAFCFISLIGSYLLAVVAASAITAAKTDWKLLPILLFVFPCYHFGYGSGFLRGVWDFAILRRGAACTFAELTRDSRM